MLRKKNLKGQLTVGILLIILISSIGSATQLSNNNISINDELFSIPHSSRKTIYVDDNNTDWFLGGGEGLSMMLKTIMNKSYYY